MYKSSSLQGKSRDEIDPIIYCLIFGVVLFQPMLIPEIETPQLLLRRFTPSDLESLFLIYSDPAVMRYLQGGLPISREETKHHLTNFIEKYWEQHSFGRWALVIRRSNELVGYCGLTMLNDEPELVYALASSSWGKGLGTEAARACLRYGFEELKLDRIVAITHPDHEASQRVLKKIGMKFEKRERLYGMDMVRYSISLGAYKPDDSAYVLTFKVP